MSDEQINIAIAEARGWKHEFDGNYKNPKWYWIPPNDPDGDGEPPDYCNDLNAMHEAEKSLTGGHWMIYCEFLTYLLGKSVYASIHSTARDRAEAFLRTIGKWEETE